MLCLMKIRRCGQQETDSSVDLQGHEAKESQFHVRLEGVRSVPYSLYMLFMFRKLSIHEVPRVAINAVQFKFG